MTEMPKIPHSVIARLQGGPPRGSAAIAAQHPDANLLSAFSENSLQKRERSQLMAHFAQCPQCRDVLALQAAAAAQIAGEASPAKARQRGRGWLARTELRWAAVAASVAVVAGIVLLRQPERINEPRMASSSAASPPQEQAIKKQDNAALENKSPLAKKEKPRVAVPENEISREATELTSSFGPPPRPAANGSATSAGSSIAQPWEDSIAANNKHREQAGAPVRAPAAAKAMPTTTVATANGNFDREILRNKDKVAAPDAPLVEKEKNSQIVASAPAVSASADASPTLTQSPSPTAASGRKNPSRAAEVGDRRAETQTAAPDTGLSIPIITLNHKALPTPEYPAIPGFPGYSPRKLPARVPPLGERWRVEQGMLQWSENAGQTWSTVGTGPGGEPPLTTASLGHELWAGDSQGGLSHSLDNGQHWQRVDYGGTENIDGATIVSILIPSPGHIVIRNSAGHTWTTSDNGKTWRMELAVP